MAIAASTPNVPVMITERDVQPDRAVAERVHDQRQRQTGEDEPGDVEAAAAALAVLLQVLPAEARRRRCRSGR